jgi:putative ABC transport system permease protein
MYFVYLRRELRRRARQAVLIAIGLAVGIGLVVTVSAASAGVKSAQGEVLHSLYGVGTDITVTKTAAPGSSGAQRFRFGGGANHAEITPGQHISRQTLRPSFGESTLPYSDVAKVSSLAGAAGATGALTLTDTSFSGTIPSFREAGGRFGEPAGATGSEAGRSGPSAAFSVSTFTVDGVAISSSQVGPLTAAEVTKGSYFKASEADSPVAIVSSTYAKQHSLSVGSKLSVAEEKVSGERPVWSSRSLPATRHRPEAVWLEREDHDDISARLERRRCLLPCIEGEQGDPRRDGRNI